MKLKLQQGGTFVPPFAVYQPFITPTEQTQTKSSSKESSKKVPNVTDLMKDVLGDLKGLPGDRKAILSTLSSLFGNIERKLNNPEMFGGTGSIASEYLQA